MGKKLGKWIRPICFGKKELKSISSKPWEIPCLKKSSYEKASSTLRQEPVDSLVIQPSLIPGPAPITVAGGYEKPILEINGGEVSVSLLAERTVSSVKQGGDAITIAKSGVLLEYERHRLEQATTRLQATFRGYRARREFHTLKSIVRLQAVIRGHLVRRKGGVNTDCSRSEQDTKLNFVDRGQQDPKTILNFATDIPCWSEVDTEKPRRKQWNLPKTPLRLFAGLKIIHPPEAIRGTECIPSISIKEDKRRTLPVGDDPVICSSNLVVSDAWDKQVSLVNETNNSKEGWIRKQENQKTRSIQDPLTKNHHDQVMGQSGTKGQSHPSTTVNTKVKAKGQDTTSIGQDVAGNSFITRQFGKDIANSRAVTRRYSLPSSENGTANASSPVQWLGKKDQSHMTATKCAKVKVKGHIPQRYGQRVDDNRYLTRRNSLPLSGNRKPEASPPVYSTSGPSGISGARLDRSLTSSRGPLIQPEWKF